MSGTCICDEPDEWCRTLVETGYPPCPRCGRHHRHPETCEGITLDDLPLVRWLLGLAAAVLVGWAMAELLLVGGPF